MKTKKNKFASWGINLILIAAIMAVVYVTVQITADKPLVLPMPSGENASPEVPAAAPIVVVQTLMPGASLPDGFVTATAQPTATVPAVVVAAQTLIPATNLPSGITEPAPSTIPPQPDWVNTWGWVLIMGPIGLFVALGLLARRMR